MRHRRQMESWERMGFAWRMLMVTVCWMWLQHGKIVASMLMDEQPQANVLVWGLGGDSGLWMNANRRGRTVFLENLVPWIDTVQHRIPSTCTQR